MQKVQAVNADFSPYVDANANPSLHQMVTQMISDKVQVEANEEDHTGCRCGERAASWRGLTCNCSAREKTRRKLVVGGSHKIAVAVDRARLQAIATEAGHPELCLPQSLDGATVGVQVPRSVQVQYGTCPSRRERQQVVSDNMTGPSPTTTEFSDCVRLREGPDSRCQRALGLDVSGLAEIGLETAGMTAAAGQRFPAHHRLEGRPDAGRAARAALLPGR